MIFKMTIKTRNRINLFLIFISLTLLVFIGILIPFLYTTGKLAVPADIPYVKFQQYFLTRFNFTAVLFSIFIFPLYSFIMLLYLNVAFATTQSTDITYFSLLLIACLAEPVRLCFPFFDLWHTKTHLALVASTVMLSGRILAPLSLLFAVIYNKTESRHYVDQNIPALSVVSIYIPVLLPFNHPKQLPLCQLEYGYPKVFTSSQHALFLAAIITQTISFFQDKSQRTFPYGMILMCTGYLFLCSAYSFLLLGTGTVLLFTGSMSYLKALHKMYLWNDL